jgi:glyoxylase-like metal-dependent hydrolase (beta-lactamase superfamily II)
MRRSILVALVCVVAATQQPIAQQPDPIKVASDALGATALKTLRFTAFGSAFTVGQNPRPTEPWPKVAIKSYEAVIDYDAAAMKVDMTRVQGPVPPRGGGQPFTGEQRQVQAVNGTTAWNEVFGGQANAAGRGDAGASSDGRLTIEQIFEVAGVRRGGPPPEGEGRGRGAGRGARGGGAPPRPAGQVQPAPAAAVERMLQIWVTPHGFLKAAAANKAMTQKVANGTDVSFTVSGKYKVTGHINGSNEVERVSTWIDNPVLGDMLVETTYSNYARVTSELSFPTHIVQQQGGFPALELWVSLAEPNPMVDLAAPDAAKNATPPPVRVEVQKVGNGVYWLTGGTHHSVAVEMRDHVVLVEAPLNEERSTAVVAKVKETIPNKPIRFVVNTHHHFDHSGGLRTLVDEGATVVTHTMNRDFYVKAWAAPRTLNPDRLAKSKKMPVFQPFLEKSVLTDGVRTIELHRIANSPHHDGFAMVYVPAEKILIEADAFTPADANAAAPAPAATQASGPTRPPQPPSPVSPATVNLYQNITRLKLNVDKIVPLHGPRVATLDELAKIANQAGTQ